MRKSHDLQDLTNAFSRYDQQDDVATKPIICKSGVLYQAFDTFTKGLVDVYIHELPSLGSVSNDGSPRIHRLLSNLSDIRILTLEPGGIEDDLRCTLHVCSLGFEYPIDPDERPYTGRSRLAWAVSRGTKALVWYTALSYVWGPPILDKPLICDGFRTAITRNLDLALRHLRQPDTAVNLWVDQLCINQSDLDEKGVQVSLMRKVYKRSWSTVIWLGSEADNSSQAIEWMRSFNSVFQYDLDEETPDAEYLAKHGLPVPGSRDWEDLSRFLARSRFQRVWVIQEVSTIIDHSRFSLKLLGK